MNFERVDDVADLPPTSLANAIRVIVQPPPEARMTIGLRSGGQAYWLRVGDGRIAAGRGEAERPDVTLAGEPVAVLAALVVGEAADDRIEIEGDYDALKQLRAMVVLPERLRETALAAVA
jgi:hypothetical protein